MPPKQNPRRPRILLDFDQTISTYASGWLGPKNIPDPPVDKTKWALDILIKHFEIVIFSVRANSKAGTEGIAEYMKKHDLPYDRITHVKEAGLILDNECICFRGSWPEAMKKISEFKNWTEPNKKKFNKKS